jgi:hypothetical protein
VPIYQVAAKIGMHPVRLSKYLNEHLPISPALATKIQRALTEFVEQRSSEAR